MEEIRIAVESLRFEEIEPYIEATGEGDTGLSSRLKIKRNFDKIRNVLIDMLDRGMNMNVYQTDGAVIYESWVQGKSYYSGDVNPETGKTETSFVFRRGKLYMCLRSLTQEEPGYGCSDWKVVEGDTTLTLHFFTSAAMTYEYGDYIQAVRGAVRVPLYPRVFWGQEDVTDRVTAWTWSRETVNGGTEERWRTERDITLTDLDMPVAWSWQNPACFTCTARLETGEETSNIVNI